MSSFSLYAHALLTLICILQALEKKKKRTKELSRILEHLLVGSFCVFEVNSVKHIS